MKRRMSPWLGAVVVSLLSSCAFPMRGGQEGPTPSFFVTSAGVGNGANLGGLEGADRHCQTLAQAAGFGSRTWRAYLSQSARAGQPAVNARDRIGQGPWYNVNGTLIAQNVAELHGPSNGITKQTALTERGEVVTGVGDTPNRHDMLTGTQPDGTAYAGEADQTCGNWTSSSTGAARLGHHDRMPANPANLTSWNSAHGSRGCSQPNLVQTGGAGQFYCFAI